MNSQLEDFKNKLNSKVENKTDKYWLDQVGFEISPDGNLNIYVGSDFIKSSIEKKVFNSIEKVYKSIKPGHNCVFVLDKSFIKTPQSVEVIEEKVEDEIVEDQPVFD